MGGDINYFDLNHPLAFSGSLRRLTKGDRLLEKWYQSQPTYTLHKATKRKFPTRKYTSSGLDHIWQADLVDMQQFKQQNKGYAYILTAIDIFSRQTWAAALKSKHAPEVIQGFERIFSSGRKPHKLQTDQGLEFENKQSQAFFKKCGIHHYTVKSVYKAALVERFHRTLRSRMFRYFTKMGTRQWWDVLDKLLTGYNNTPHRGIDNQTPASITSETEFAEWERQQELLTKPTKQPKLHVGDTVRLQKAKKTFDRGYTPNWTEELFKVNSVDKSYYPITYAVEDDDGEVIEGKFYEPELQKVESVYRIERVLKSKTVKGVKYHLVKWVGDRYPRPEWIRADTINV